MKKTFIFLMTSVFLIGCDNSSLPTADNTAKSDSTTNSPITDTISKTHGEAKTTDNSVEQTETEPINLNDQYVVLIKRLMEMSDDYCDDPTTISSFNTEFVNNEWQFEQMQNPIRYANKTTLISTFCNFNKDDFAFVVGETWSNTQTFKKCNIMTLVTKISLSNEIQSLGFKKNDKGQYESKSHLIDMEQNITSGTNAHEYTISNLNRFGKMWK